MSGVFINYRTGDGHQAAAHLNRELRQVFGAEKIFLDSTDLPPGAPFPPELDRRLRDCTVLLVLIGPNWLILRNPLGERLIDQDKDFVRYEIETSLQRNITIIPLVLDGTPLPKSGDLPSGIAELSNHSAMSLRSRNLELDLPALVAVLSEHVPRPTRPEPAASPGARTGTLEHGVLSQGDHTTNYFYENGA
ncbi:toll/interleukin-1 receptor domain-containing protein [Dactylosporangium sp. NPDC051485]|uniref:toll/interleukin-1 receptor domain-containing protein n=1 Tax=Dactylosporangium sp. NPDC051485 TaxID=3154846 RepID=UPI0034217637